VTERERGLEKRHPKAALTSRQERIHGTSLGGLEHYNDHVFLDFFVRKYNSLKGFFCRFHNEIR
jgi:hypothetical protein